MSNELRDFDYTLLQITNPLGTVYHLLTAGMNSLEAGMIVVVVPLAGLVVFLLNMPAILREIRQVRIAAPERVQEEEAILAPAPVPAPLSPWD
jgi:hypothetical protein